MEVMNHMLDQFWRRTAGPALLVAAVILGAPGCGSEAPQYPKVAPVSGKVTAKAQPAVGAVVTFHPVSPTVENKLRPSGVVQADGTFRLTTYTTGDGAAPGDYAVTLAWPEKEDPDLEVRGIEVRDRFQNRFKDPKRPYKRVTVRDGNNELDPFVIE
jgi:hypothetical protein